MYDNNVIIDYASDFYLESWFNMNTSLEEEDFINFWKSLNPQGQALIIAGNLSKHYQLSFELLSCLKENFYDDIFLVLGNIDYYSPELYNKEDIQTFDRLYLTERFCRDNDIYLLQGDVIDYYGLTIGGFNSWYDTSATALKYNDETKYHLWNTLTKDSKYIDGYSHYKDIWKQELQKLKSLLIEIKERQEPLDIMVSHFCPIACPMSINPGKEITNDFMFKYFNGQALINSKLIKNWIYGSTGFTTNFDINEVNFFSNYIGKNKNTKNINNTNIINSPSLKQFIF